MEDQEITAPDISVPPGEHPGRSASVAKLYTALSKFQGEISEPENNCYNDHLHYWYPDLGACWKAIREPLANNSLLLIQFTVPHPDPFMVRLVTEIAHASGEWKSSVLDGRVQELAVSFDEDGKMLMGEWNRPAKIAQDSHGNSSKSVVIGYLKRLSLCMITGLSTDDEVPADAETILARKVEAKKTHGGGGKKTFTKKTPPQGGGQSNGQGAKRDAQITGIKKALGLYKLTDETLLKLFKIYSIENLDQLPDQELSGFSKALLAAKKLQDKLATGGGG